MDKVGQKVFIFFSHLLYYLCQLYQATSCRTPFGMGFALDTEPLKPSKTHANLTAKTK